MILGRAIDEFLSYLKYERNLSPRTIKAYEYDLFRFADSLAASKKQRPQVEKISQRNLREYLYDLQIEHNLKGTTISRVLSSLRTFFRFLLEREIIKTDPSAFLRNPKLPRKLPVFLTENELRALLQAPDVSTEFGLRDRAILVTLGFTGIRLSELVNLKVENISFETNMVRIFGKGSKERMIPLNGIVVEELKNYLEKRPVTDTPEIFLNKFGKKLSGRYIEKMVKKYIIQAGISKRNISPHKLRHTFATLLHSKNVDIVEIQKLLGHANIISTQIYTHTSSEKLKQAVKSLEDI